MALPHVFSSAQSADTQRRPSLAVAAVLCSVGAAEHSFCRITCGTVNDAHPKAPSHFLKGDFSFVPELQCIQLKQEHVLCTAEINIPLTKLLGLETENRMSPSRFSSIYYLCQ